jgi:hypothetical protein
LRDPHSPHSKAIQWSRNGAGDGVEQGLAGCPRALLRPLSEARANGCRVADAVLAHLRFGRMASVPDPASPTLLITGSVGIWLF